ncbi:MAG: hypothetical protein ACI8SJ_002594, partial [Shewanella sp.]
MTNHLDVFLHTMLGSVLMNYGLTYFVFNSLYAYANL